MKSLAAWTVLCIALSTAPSYSQDPDCSDTSDLNQGEMNFCAGKAYQAADAELNAVWKQVYPSLKRRDEETGFEEPTLAEAVLEAQRNWIAYRDSNCRSQGLIYRGGSIVPLIVSSCLESMTEQRIKELREFLPQ